MPAKKPTQGYVNPTGAMDVGLTLADVKRRYGTKGSIYDSRSQYGIRSKGKKRKSSTEGYV